MVIFDKEPSLNHWFSIWADEAKKAGYIHEWWDENDIEPYKLQREIAWVTTSEKVVYKGTKREKTKITEHKEIIFKAIQYTPDFKIVWTEKARGVLFENVSVLQRKNLKRSEVPFLSVFEEDGLAYSMVDVKSPPGSGSKNCSDASFRVNSKWVFAQTSEIVNKCYLIPNKKIAKSGEYRYLFLATWTPLRYLFTNKTLVKKSIRNWIPRTVELFKSFVSLGV